MRAAVVYIRVVAIVFLIFGVIALVVPDGYLALLGADASVGGRLWGRAFGAAAVTFGAVLWELSRGDPAGVRLAARAAVLVFGLTGLADLLSVVQGLGEAHERDRGDAVPDLRRKVAQRHGGGSDARQPDSELVDALAEAR